MNDSSDTNVAEILRNIAAESDAVSGKIIKLANKAAKQGKSSIMVDVSQEDHDSIRNYRPAKNRLTAPMERLFSLGFMLSDFGQYGYYFGGEPKYKIKVSW